MQEMADLDARRRQEHMQVVLDQPHRNGDRHQWRSCPLGRFVLDHGLRPEFYDAGEAYARLVRRIWSAKGVPSDVRSGAKPSKDPSDKEVRAWERDEEKIRTALMRVSTQAFLTVRRVAVDMREIRPELENDLIAGLQVVSTEMNFTRPGEHPFLQR